MIELIDSFIKSGTGAIIGFALAQFTNISYFFWQRRKRPKFRIGKINGTYKIFDGYEDEYWNDPEAQQYTCYAFRIRNIGRSVAQNLRARIVKLEVKLKGRDRFGEVSQGVGDLCEFIGPRSSNESMIFTLVPQASIDVQFAGTCGDFEPTIFPTWIKTIDHYDRIEDDAIYKFSIVVFDNDGNYTSKTIILDSTKG